MIAIVDYGVGNLFSLLSSLRALDLEAEVTGDAGRLRAADRIILPGVAAYLVQICFTVSASGVILLFWILLALCERDINLPNYKEEDLK